MLKQNLRILVVISLCCLVEHLKASEAITGINAAYLKRGVKCIMGIAIITNMTENDTKVQGVPRGAS